jgi:hypothetical protein
MHQHRPLSQDVMCRVLPVSVIVVYLGLGLRMQSHLHTWAVLLLLAVRSFRGAVVEVASGVSA